MKKVNNKTKCQTIKSIIDLDFLDEEYNELQQTYDKRETMLDELLEKAKDLSCKYLCLLGVWNENAMREHWKDDYVSLVYEDKMSYAEADSVMGVVEVILKSINDKLHDYWDGAQ